MSSLEAQLGFDASDPALERATRNAEENFKLIAELVSARKAKGLKQSEVGAMLGVSQATVAAFERSSNDPKLSTIRKYANAIGVVVAHQVILSNQGEDTIGVDEEIADDVTNDDNAQRSHSSWFEMHIRSTPVSYCSSRSSFMDWATSSAYEQTQADFVVAS